MGLWHMCCVVSSLSRLSLVLTLKIGAWLKVRGSDHVILQMCGRPLRDLTIFEFVRDYLLLVFDFPDRCDS